MASDECKNINTTSNVNTSNEKINIKNEKAKTYNIDTDKKQHVVDLNILDKTSISKLLTFSAKELFQIQEQASIEFEKANYRKKWIDGVIELKYKTTIESAYKKAIDYFNSEPLVELDKYNEDNLTEYIEDNGLIIKVEFYRSISDITDRPQVKKRFTLLQTTLINKKAKR
ncbi:MAG TPA: hypothetical protein VLL98_02245 [Rickettsiales bacterium]|nr:hypothetical protein [Rickettsiales bacterium]